MKRYVQVVVDVDGYDAERRDAIIAAATPLLDWSRVMLGETEGFMQYDGPPPCDDCDCDCDDWASRLHEALVSANGGALLHVMVWFYELEPCACFEFGAAEEDD